ncbi:orotidine-5'-phosphate decarboxylase [Psychroflexus planctonicus]|uniref:Orotidine 5'-phosphate decarboxylase n=1 Tax=Psychroflexus planctonicus TaxID=1526575 RepID=A0ABQ1SGL3_9FLAO|nr:orotidine-5'-phosphate decarboxylase [Psychroflexus planctonicus]GGE39001.1 orotidine 5'-phosphate decarboxylase [Psychroflexus planctonicus]
MQIQDLVKHIKEKKSFLCVGLDPDLDKMPSHLTDSPNAIFEFNKQIIDATHTFCVAYKPNMAFYEAHGIEGHVALQKTISYLNETYPKHFTIADAKRGDIGNTSRMYAKAFLEDLDFDSITVAPYMGIDSVEPFLKVDNKFTILLALTSNEGAKDFQLKQMQSRNKNSIDFEEISLFEQVIKTSQTWSNAHRLMYVVGATQTEHIQSVRNLAPDAFLLVPGVGAQGGSLSQVCKYGLNENIGLLVNSSRGILYASKGKDFADAAAAQAQKLQLEMADFL